MIFVGIDQSFTCTGVISLDGNKTIYEDAYKPEGRGIDRLLHITNYFETLRGRRFVPDDSPPPSPTYFRISTPEQIIFAIEGYSYLSGKAGGYGKQPQAGEISAVIQLALSPYLCVIYPPAQHRSKSINYTKGDKKQIVRLVNKIYGTDFKKHDLADAYSIAVALREDFTKLKNLSGTVLFDSFMKKTPFKNITKGQKEVFERLLDCDKN